MRKIVFLTVLLVTMLGCKEDLTFNTPSFDAIKNNEPWRADGFVAYNDENGNLSIKGELGTESVVLTLGSPTVGVKNITSSTSTYATYTDATGTVFSTLNDPDNSLTLYPLGGKVIVDEVGGTVSGRFQFSAFTSDGMQGVTFSGNANSSLDNTRYGIFYRVNYNGGLVSGQTDNTACANAANDAFAAQTVYAATPDTDPAYSTVCATYQAALQAVIDNCSGTAVTDAQAAIATLMCP